MWGGLIRIFLYQHATFAVNSICHLFGSKDFRARDESGTTGSSPSRLRGGLAQRPPRVPVLGRHGLAWWQYDVSWWIIRGLERLGLAWDVRLPTVQQMRRRAVRA